MIIRNTLLLTFSCAIFVAGVFAQTLNLEFKSDSEANKNCRDFKVGKATLDASPKVSADSGIGMISGVVNVHLKVDETGAVQDVISSDGPEVLRQTAIDTARKISFQPSTCDGAPIPVTGVISFNYKPLLLTASYQVPDKIEGYADVKPDSLFYEPVLDLTENYKITFGYADGKFHPYVPLNKGDFLQFLYLTLKMLENRAAVAGKDFETAGVFNHLNEHELISTSQIADFDSRKPYAAAAEVLFNYYGIVLVDSNRELKGNLPLSQNEVMDYWAKIFGDDALPVNFQRISKGDRVMTRGEFALFLRESLYVLTYRTLP
ncbi:MAG: energy transducer TonB [Pyrinomonadaceae bacterium]